MRAKHKGSARFDACQGIDIAGTMLAPLSDAEPRERVGVLRERGLLALRPPADEFADEPTAVAVPHPSPIPREERERLAVEARETPPPSTRSDCGPLCDCGACENERAALATHGTRFPRTAVVMHAAELADRCRCAASLLEAVAAGVPSSQPNVARRQADAIVRALVKALGERVSLALFVLACALATACGGIATGDSSATLCADATMTDAQLDALTDAAAEWNDRAGTTLTVEQGECRESADRLMWHVTPDANVERGLLAETHASTLLIGFRTARAGDALRADFLHEIGHALGVPHVSDTRAIMYPGDLGQLHLDAADLSAFEAVRGGGAS